MGICASCLGLKSDADEEIEPEETTHLIPQADQQPGYGTSGQSEEPSITDVPPLLEDTQESTEQARLSTIWKGISDKLIDISLLRDQHANLQQVNNNQSQQIDHEPNVDTSSSTQTSLDYDRLFHDTLPRKPQPPARPTIQNDTFTPPKTPNGDTKEGMSEQEWLRDIITRNPEDRSWDPNTVHKIGRPLLVNFDDVVAEGENER